jgi:hypothetical protein
MFAKKRLLLLYAHIEINQSVRTKKNLLSFTAAARHFAELLVRSSLARPAFPPSGIELAALGEGFSSLSLSCGYHQLGQIKKMKSKDE